MTDTIVKTPEQMSAPDSMRTAYVRFCLGVFLTVGVLLGIIWLWVYFEPMAFLEDQFPVWRAKLQMAESGPSGGVFILGDSRPVAALIPQRMGPDVVNLALPGGGPIDMYFTAKKLVSRSPLPQVVILSVSPPHFVVADGFWIRSVEFNYLSLAEINEVRATARNLKDDAIFGPKSPGDVEAQLKTILYLIKFPSYYFPSLYNAHIDGRYADNMRVWDMMFETRGQMFFGKANGSVERDQETALKSFVPSRVLDFYFDRTVSLLGSKGIPVYFVAIPHNAASERIYFPGFREKFVEYLSQYPARYPGFHVLGDPFPSDPASDFGDANHLSPEASARWSDHVVQLLNQSNVNGGPFGPQN